MKRSREEGASQHRRPAISSRVELSGQAQILTASRAQRLTTVDAMTYLRNVKEVFQDRKDMYDKFLEVMKDFKGQRIDTSGVIMRVKELFKGRPDLILGFNTFLPKGYEITLPLEDGAFSKKKPIEFDEAVDFVNKIKARFQGDDHVYKAFLAILNMYQKEAKSVSKVYQEVSVLFRDHVDLLVEFTHFLPDASGSAVVQPSLPGSNHFLHGDDKDPPFPMEKTMPTQKNFVDKEEEREYKENNNDGGHRGRFDNLGISACGDDYETDHSDRGTQEPGAIFCEKVKERLQDSGNYEKFLDCVRSYQGNFVTSSQFRKLVAALLETYPDLLEESEDFITYIEKTEQQKKNFQSMPNILGRLQSSRQIFRSSKVEQGDENHDREDKEINNNDNRERDRYDRGFAANNKDILGQRMSPYMSKDKFAAKPIHELDLSNCDSCTPSYRLLPENYPIPKASFRTKIGVEVLNDQWVSVTSGSEDYSFKHMRKNQYEESLFRCEDDRFELDMLLESVNATAKRVEDLLDSMNSGIDKMESTFCINDHLTTLDIRCIERLYGDHGLDVIDVLNKNAPLALPVILTRLKQKQEEWMRCRAEFSKVWADIYAKNYHKSLDHRSFYFKQQDTKNLSAKALLAEIKEISENNEISEGIVLSVGAGHKQPVRTLEFKYADFDIHEDLYQLINYASGELCTPEQHDKVMKIWTNFLEKLLGIPTRPLNMEENLKDETDMDGNVEGNVCSAGEGAILNPTSVYNGDETEPTKNIGSSGVHMENGKNGDKNETSAVSENKDIESKMLSDGPQKLLIQNDGNVTARSWTVREQSSSIMERKNSTDEENASDPKNEPDSVRGIGAAPSEEEQQGNVNPMPSSVETPVKRVETQTHHEETDVSGREEGELSPNENLEDSNQVAQNPHASAAATMDIEGEDIDTNVDEGEESAQGSLEGENASENEDLSVSESANVEESPDALDEDVVHNEDDKVESEVEADNMTDLDDTDVTMSDLDRFLRTVKPLSLKVPLQSHGKEQNSQTFYANDSLYLLFRFHQMLYERMQSAKLHSTSMEGTWRTSNSSIPSDSYERFKEALYSLLDGSSDNPKFEDDCRAIIGAQSYVLFTLDKLIHKLLKQLQAIATEDVENKLLQLYAYEKSRNPEKFADAVYHLNARFLLPDDNLYRIECFPCSPMRLSIQLMRNDHDNRDPTAVLMDPDFAAYLHGDLLSVVPERTGYGLFLKRNKRKLSTGSGDDDTIKAMEGGIIHNGMEMTVSAKTMKAAYVLGTEDIFYRTRKRRLTLYGTSNGYVRRRKSKFGLKFA